MMNKIAFLSMDSLAEFCVYDDLLIAPFAEFGIEVVTVSWHDHGVDYRQFDAVIVRSPWDYQQHEAAFVACLRRIASATRLINPLPLLLWNLNKSTSKN